MPGNPPPPDSMIGGGSSLASTWAIVSTSEPLESKATTRPQTNLSLSTTLTRRGEIPRTHDDLRCKVSDICWPNIAIQERPVSSSSPCKPPEQGHLAFSIPHFGQPIGNAVSKYTKGPRHRQEKLGRQCG